MNLRYNLLMTHIRNKSWKMLMLCALVAFLNSCKDDNTYNVPNEFKSYVTQFAAEAAKRGHTFNFEKSGLIMEFADLKDGVAGVCHYEKPIRIEIDKAYWEKLGTKSGAELMREDIIFHELGHGFLNRKHDNSLLENGDWKTIMCGGDKLEDRAWNINYRGIRRDYYLNELFNTATPAPDFSSLFFVADSTGYADRLKLNFDTKETSGWEIKNTENYETTLDNGKLKFVSKISQTYAVLAKTSLSTQNDLIFECSIQTASATPLTDQFGLIFGYNSDKGDAMEYMTINKQKHFYTGNSNWYSYYTELSSTNILPDALNRLKIVKSGNMLYYFINNKYVYQDNMESTQAGDYFGFMVPALGTVWLENFRIATKGSASGVKQSVAVKTVEYRVVELNKEFGNVIKSN